jgi:hypothetical protein
LIWVSASFAQEKASLRQEADRLAIALDGAKQLLLLIGMNQDGEISKQQSMNILSAEFGRQVKDNTHDRKNSVA